MSSSSQRTNSRYPRRPVQRHPIVGSPHTAQDNAVDHSRVPFDPSSLSGHPAEHYQDPSLVSLEEHTLLHSPYPSELSTRNSGTPDAAGPSQEPTFASQSHLLFSGHGLNSDEMMSHRDMGFVVTSLSQGDLTHACIVMATCPAPYPATLQVNSMVPHWLLCLVSCNGRLRLLLRGG